VSTTEGGGLDALAALCNLVDPVRRHLYEYVTSRSEPVTREEAAAAAGIGRTLAAYHLDKLTESGLIEAAGYARRAGYGGPGAGRPAKHYVRAARELSVSVPARSYLLMASVLAEAVAADTTGAVRTAAARAARQIGRAAADGSGLETALRRCGYEPARTKNGDIMLRNCPFHQLAKSHVDLVCGLNRDLIDGLLEGAGQGTGEAVLSVQDGRCCVVIRLPVSLPCRQRPGRQTGLHRLPRQASAARHRRMRQNGEPMPRAPRGSAPG
jgi:predicted ArsR family transcriptional regulator